VSFTPNKNVEKGRQEPLADGGERFTYGGQQKIQNLLFMKQETL
jgi:hypothetical protein